MTLYSTLTRRATLRPVSAKREALEAARDACRKAVRLRAGSRCEAGPLIQSPCWGPLDVHEVKPRGRGGSITDPDNCLLVCRRHHDWIGEHPQSALELGLLKHSWEGE